VGVYSDLIFPWMLDRADPPALRGLRRDVLRDVGGRVLEIGFGTGLSLACYPREVRRIVAVEPAGAMNRFAAPRVEAWGGTLEMHTLAGERLPFPDASFDSAVSILTLCSVRDPAAVAGELRRVLRPGGGLHVIEHVAAATGRAAWCQRRLDPLHRVVACGCSLRRDTEATLVEAGFRFQRIERGPLTGDPPLVNRLFPAIWGKASRP
jgi:ubiquinone/menaquinone biosynthesis C-methylase UbiE